MAARRTARARWEGSLVDGQGQLSTESSGILGGTPVTWGSRTEEPEGRTSPEELLAAAHAACYAMALSNTLAKRQMPPQTLDVTATCTFDRVEEGFKVTTMELEIRGEVPGIDQAGFEQAAQAAEEGCPISGAIRGNVDVRLNAQLV